ncbi:hypothetical protein LOZ53_001919 [Ophidiomyces ophidiicola]|uniref:Uncharacterized protein n=1 Tax=Ophidiomyces ophidiicola TaxID=1387563 RepID=A0ACB8UUL1_9EURO|nr:uncharacterized protein LOZ57_006752 [Ophidiomyces ophidiicola]KAI1906916.1 hypothetical protein LOZ61_006423 [Ophidiomyces ophidiicola]KAI1925172.1 hypothetical protein LOZ64_000432 [Ophidiomyces ophidiicola]KAI1928059.1 hypothetical protein LOZ60_002681 [Ophidiomyces ophidiicola]KAI1936177.1 hypothetical protein LOZ62_005766 [Ophidiomyces ophidiicola]KAI1936475.1 hypothetical protein LOZ57_006752 [Ophidiomyces ophidiicola]
MVAISQDALTQVSTDATSDFVQSFYNALQSARASISSFYCSAPVSILFNGNIVTDGSSVQDIFLNQIPPAHYEVQSYDCQLLNANYPTTAGSSTTAAGRPGARSTSRNMSLLVLVSGFVRFGDGRESFDMPNRGFSETFVLIPNPELDGGSKRRDKKHWLIQSQNFRLVV